MMYGSGKAMAGYLAIINALYVFVQVVLVAWYRGTEQDL